MEEVGQAVEENESLLSCVAGDKLVVTETHADEKGGEDDEAHKLNGFAAPRVNEEEGNPVSWNKTCDGEDQISDTDVPQVVEDLGRSGGAGGSETNGSQDDGRVETEAVEGDLKGRVRN